MPSKSNRFKKESNESKGLSSSGNKFSSLVRFFLNEKLHKLVGLGFLLTSFFLLLAFTSFLFTWRIDQDLFYDSWRNILFNSTLQAENWLGKLGAIVSHQFMYNWFGVASFTFPLLFFLTGFRILFKISIFPLAQAYRYALFVLAIISTTLSYFFYSSSLLFLGGAFGYYTNLWLKSLLGVTGTGFLLLFIVLAFLIITFNIAFTPRKKIDEETELEESDNNVEEEKKDLLKNELKPIILAREDDQDNTINFPINSQEENGREIEEAITELELKKDNITLAIETPKEETVSVNGDNIKILEHEYDPTLDLSSYQFPTLDLLENYGSNKIQVNKEELEDNKNRIVETLGHYSIDIDKIKATIGPTVTLYEIVPKAGVRISKIKNLEDDIALSLSALGIRIIAPIPGKGTIGIEVPNQKPEVVSMRSVLASDKFQNSDMDLPIGLGKTISNEVLIADLAKMPHLLMAGATGQGKSVGLNAVLISLIYKKHPSQVKFVLVDPKKVELTLFKKIERHFLAKLPGEEEAIITDTKKVINTMNSLCIEMDQRYDLLKDAQVRNIKEYNAKFIARKLNPNNGHRFLPYVILVIDEFADLIMTAGKEIETPIARLAQLARAIGIHLIIATQRPSVNIITGTIKANFPARMAFRVTSKIDSRTILDVGGADQLIGRGDMLLSTGADLIRLQCAYVDTHEVERITDFIGSQRGYPEAFLLPEYHDEASEGNAEFNSSEKDPFFEEAARIIVLHQQGSASLLQRRLKLGYNRAGRIIDQLEAAGIIGPFEGSKPRSVLISDEYSLEQYLLKMK